MGIRIRKRYGKSIYNKNDISTLYCELVLYCENDESKGICYDMRRKPFCDIKRKYGLSFEYDLKMLKNTEIKTNVFYFNSRIDVVKWFSHLRNAFAHNRIFIDKKNCIIIQDVIKRKGIPKLTMHAKIDSMLTLQNMIKDIKSTQIKRNSYETT